MNFDIYLKNDWIKPHQSAPDEIRGPLAIADRDLAQCRVPDLAPEWRFDIAYNAALSLATAVLAASGYEAQRQNKHQRTIECLAFSFKELPAEDVAFFDKCRQKRHVSVYDQVGAISDLEASEMIAWAQRLKAMTHKWLKRHHPRLI